MRTPLLGMIGLALHRLRSRWALTVLSLAGVVLAVGLVSSVPVFAQAVSYLVLQNELSDAGTVAGQPPLMLRIAYDKRVQPFTLAQTRDMEQRLGKIVAERTGIGARQHTYLIESPTLFLRSVPDSIQYEDRNEKIVFRGFTLAVLSDVDGYMRIVEGRSMAEAERGARLPVWAHEDMCNEMGLHAGESFNLFPLGSDQPIPITIAGTWREIDRQASFWTGPTLSRSGSFLVTAADYERYAEPGFALGTGFSGWYFTPQQQDLSLDRVDGFATGLEVLPTIIENVLPTAKIVSSPVEAMRDYAKRRDSLSDLLVNFSLPAVGLLFYFLSLISTVIAQFQREETSIMSGRGAGLIFILGITALETVLLMIVGTPLGLGVGYLMVRMMGYTSGFLAFIERPAFAASMNGVNWRLIGTALLVLLAARLIPTFSAARRSVVTHMRERSRPVALSAAVKLAVDIPLILLTAYAYRQIKLQDVPTLIRLNPQGDVFREPLFLLAPLLCIFTAALVLSHLFPLLMRPLAALSRRSPWVSIYMGVRRLYGQSAQYTSALFLVIICLSMGAFYSSMAMSMDQWLHDRMYYAVGSDYAFKQGVVSGGASSDAGGRQAGAWVLPVSDYLGLPGVEAATRVGVYGARTSVPKNNALKVRFLGIDRLTFPQASFFRGDFSPMPLGDLMNQLGRTRNGVLVSRQFLKQYNILDGQKLTLDVAVGEVSQKIDFLVAGTFDYFPTAYPRREETLVGNLDYLFEQTGDPSQYDIWLKTSAATSGEQLDENLQAIGVLPLAVGDARALLRKEGEQAERIGIFGVLTIGFIAGSLLSWLGLLVYTSASMQGRMQQIGVLKAIGVQTYETVVMEGVEYVGVILYGVLGGVAAGALTSYLFVPFFQFNVTPVTAVPPFLPLIAWDKIFWFSTIFAGALVISEIAILYQTTRKDIFQALRMGQRE
jgi:putative ABC transport system permease protein